MIRLLNTLIDQFRCDEEFFEIEFHCVENEFDYVDLNQNHSCNIVLLDLFESMLYEKILEFAFSNCFYQVLNQSIVI